MSPSTFTFFRHNGGNLSGQDAQVHSWVQVWWSPMLKMATQQDACRRTKQYKHENLSAVNTQHKLTEDLVYHGQQWTWMFEEKRKPAAPPHPKVTPGAGMRQVSVASEVAHQVKQCQRKTQQTTFV